MRNLLSSTVRKLISFLLAAALVIGNFNFCCAAAGSEEENFKRTSLLLNSNTADKTSINAYLYKSTYFITIDDLCLLTRSSQTVNGDLISVVQGFWSVTFDVQNQLFYDGWQSVSVTILKISNEEYAIPALLFLNYFKAFAFIENDVLYCRMREFTAWEALDVDFNNSLVDIYELYGGENKVEFSLAKDIIIDFIMGNASSADSYLQDAFCCALGVNLNDYDAIRQYKELSQNNLYSDIHSKSGEEFISDLETSLPASAEATQWYIDYYFGLFEKSAVNNAWNALESGQHVEVENYTRKFYDAFEEKNRTSDVAEAYFKSADFLMLFVSAAYDTSLQMKYVDATDNLIYDVMGNENLNYLGLSADDNEWFIVANEYNNVLNIGTKELESKALEYLTDEVLWNQLIGTNISSAAGISEGEWGLSLSIGRLFTKSFPLTKSTLEAFEADRQALYLSEMQQNVYWVVYNTLLNLQDNRSDLALYAKYIKALELYCRVSIAMYEKLIAMVRSLGSNPDYWSRIFQPRIDKLVIYLYRLTCIQDDSIDECLPNDISDFTLPQEAGVPYVIKYKVLNGNLEHMGTLENRFDENGILVSSISHGLDDEVQGSSMFSYEYNNKGICIRQIETTTTKDGISKTTRIYDDFGNLISFLSENDLSSQDNSTTFLFAYTNDCYGELSTNERRIFSYDQNGYAVGYTLVSIDSGKEIGKCKLTYSNDNLVANYEVVSNSSEISYLGKIEFNRERKVVSYSYYTNDGKETFSTKNEYNENGVLKYSCIESDTTHETFYNYDDSGKLFEMTSKTTVSPDMDPIIVHYIVVDSVPQPEEEYSGLVTDAYSKTITLDNGDCNFAIPRINLAGDGIESINDKIWEDIYVGVVEKNLKESSYLGGEYLKYDWTVNGDILSILIESRPMPIYWFDYYVYNVSISKSDELSTEDILSFCGLKLSEYTELVRKALYSNGYNDVSMMIKSNSDKSTIMYANEILSKTISDENVNSVKPFLNQNGHLCIVGLVYTPFDAGAYYHVIDLEDFDVSPEYPNLFSEEAGQ